MADHNKPLDREAIAHLEIGRTSISRPLAVAMTVGFLLMICGIPFVQHWRDVRDARDGKRDTVWPQSLAIVRPAREALPAIFSPGTPWAERMEINRGLMRAMKDYETELERASFLTDAFLGPTQEFFSGWPGAGNEKAYVGRDGWLFYRPDVDSVTGHGFLDPRQLARRENARKSGAPPVSPNPLPAILGFRDQLKARGITLVVMVAPNKPSVDAARFNPSAVSTPRNPSHSTFARALTDAGVPLLDGSDLAAAYRDKTGAQAFLKTDTHWTPGLMTVVAAAAAVKIEALGVLSAPAAAWTTKTERVTAEGDIVTMLKLPETQTLFPPETHDLTQVRAAGGAPWSPDPKAEVLLLGDSFTNIFSLPGMGWGSGSGFTEHLSLHLKRPVDRIARNDAGSHATREILSKELANGNDRLAGRKIVVWEFAERELASGDWKLLPMTVGTPPSVEGDFYAGPEGDAPLRITARVARASEVPGEGTVPYADHVRSLHLVDLRDTVGKPIAPQALAFVSSMAKNRHTPAAAFAPGDQVTLDLSRWELAEKQHGSFNRSEFPDDAFLLAPPVWAVPVAGTVGGSKSLTGVAVYAGVLALLLLLAIRNARVINKPRG